MWGIFSWHTLVPLVPIEHRLNATVYLSIVADHVHPFMTTVYLLMATSSRIMHHVTKLKSSQTGFLNMTMSSLSMKNACIMYSIDQKFWVSKVFFILKKWIFIRNALN